MHMRVMRLNKEGLLLLGWLGSRVVSVLDSGAEGPGFKSQPRRCRVTVSGSLFTPIAVEPGSHYACERKIERERKGAREIEMMHE